jgi:hypothetical protein
MDEYILAARPLNESISLGSAEPLHNALFLHWRPPCLAFGATAIANGFIALCFAHAFLDANKPRVRGTP